VLARVSSSNIGYVFAILIGGVISNTAIIFFSVRKISLHQLALFELALSLPYLVLAMWSFKNLSAAARCAAPTVTRDVVDQWHVPMRNSGKENVVSEKRKAASAFFAILGTSMVPLVLTHWSGPGIGGVFGLLASWSAFILCAPLTIYLARTVEGYIARAIGDEESPRFTPAFTGIFFLFCFVFGIIQFPVVYVVAVALLLLFFLPFGLH